MDKKDLPDIMVFEQRAEGGMGARPDADVWGGAFRQGGQSVQRP